MIEIKPLSKEMVKLYEDHFTLREAFIIEQMKGYMVENPDGSYSWSEQVKLRLQEKKDWEEKLKELFAELNNRAHTERFDGICLWKDVEELFGPLVPK